MMFRKIKGILSDKNHIKGSCESDFVIQSEKVICLIVAYLRLIKR